MEFSEIFAKYDNGKTFNQNPATNYLNMPEITNRDDASDYAAYSEARIFENADDANAIIAVEKNRQMRNKMRHQ